MDFEELLVRQHGLVTRRQALDTGLTEAALRHRLSTRWRVALPGVYATFTGVPTRQQRCVAALLLTGPASQLAGRTALEPWALRAAAHDRRVHVLVPHTVHRRSSGFVVVKRTTRLPEPVPVGGLPSSPLPRAVVDAARLSTSLREVRALVAEPVQRRLLLVGDLEAEVAAGESAGSGLVRRALDEVLAGTRSATEAELRTLLLTSRLLHEARWNARLVLDDGSWLADVDCYLERAGLAVESDSRAWHLSPADWEHTMQRHARMTSAGLLVLHVSPRRHRTDGAAVLREVEEAYRAGVARGGAPRVRVARRQAA